MRTQLRIKAAYMALWLSVASVAEDISYKPGDEFQDCDACPVVVVIPPGEFMMGSPDTDPDADDTERPQYRIVIDQPFAIGKFEVTRAEYSACVEDGACELVPNYAVDYKLPNHPVEWVKWSQAIAYTRWLSRRAGKAYNLPSEAQWEYAARGGTSTRYWWGDEPNLRLANCSECFPPKGHPPKGFLSELYLVGSYPANGFGLHDTAGNLAEWVLDCRDQAMEAPPLDGTARPDLSQPCEQRLIKGGAKLSKIKQLRSAERQATVAERSTKLIGFRVFRALKGHEK